MKRLVIGLVCGFAVGCGGGSGGGGGSGLDSGAPIASLDAGEVGDLCDYLVGVLGPERVIDCGDGDTRSVGGEDATECVSELSAFPDTCTITVGQYEACIEDLADLTDAQICDGQLPPTCGVLFDQGCSPQPQ